MAAAHLYYLIRNRHHTCPKIICIGCNGMIPKYVYGQTDGERHQDVLLKLGISSGNIELLAPGNNMRMNVEAVNSFIATQHDGFNNQVIWCVPKRFSLLLERTQVKQAPKLKSLWYVIDQPDIGSGLCDDILLVSEIASIRNLCLSQASDGIQAPIDVELIDAVKKDADLLEDKFRMRTNLGWTLGTFWQYTLVRRAILRNKKKIAKAENAAIRQKASDIVAEGLADEDSFPILTGRFILPPNSLKRGGSPFSSAGDVDLGSSGGPPFAW